MPPVSAESFLHSTTAPWTGANQATTGANDGQMAAECRMISQSAGP